MIFDLPLPLNLANSRLHWRKKDREKKAFWKRCDNLMYFPDFPLPPKGGPLDSVQVGHVWYVGNKMDPDNAYARLKWVLDWLRTRGYITEDRESNVQLLQPVQHIDRKNPRLVLTIKEG